MNDSDSNQTRRDDENNDHLEAETAPAPRSLASLLYESLLVEKALGGGLIEILDHRHRLGLILPTRALDQRCHLKVAAIDELHG